MGEITGLPGPKTGHTATPRDILVRDDGVIWSGKQVIIDASASRDYGQSTSPDDTDIIRAGMPLVQTSSGLYVPWVLGTLTAAYEGSGTVTTMTVGVGAAKAINQFLGGDGAGTVYITGPATSTGAVNNSGNGYDAVTVSAVDTSAGTLTISDLSTDYIVGSIIHPYDGYDAGGTADYTYAPLCIVADKYGVKVTDRDDTDVDSPVAQALIGGYVNTDYLIGFPPAASKLFVQWYKDQLHKNMPTLTFDDKL